MRLLSILMLIVVVSFSSCGCDDDVSITERLELAGKQLGIEIPWPHYLPEGFQITAVESTDDSLVLMEMKNNSDTISLTILWLPEGIIPYKIDLTEPTMLINGNTGQWIERGESHSVVWNWYPEKYAPGLIVVTLVVPESISGDELKKIAESIDWD